MSRRSHCSHEPVSSPCLLLLGLIPVSNVPGTSVGRPSTWLTRRCSERIAGDAGVSVVEAQKQNVASLLSIEGATSTRGHLPRSDPARGLGSGSWRHDRANSGGSIVALQCWLCRRKKPGHTLLRQRTGSSDRVSATIRHADRATTETAVHSEGRCRLLLLGEAKWPGSP